MNKLRLLINWILFLTIPIWGGTVLFFMLWRDLEERNYQAVKILITGEKWIVP